MVPKKSYMLISPVQCACLGKAKPVWCHAQTVAASICSFWWAGCMIHSLGQIVVSAHFQIFCDGDCHYGDIWDSFYERFYGLITEIVSHKQLL